MAVAAQKKPVDFIDGEFEHAEIGEAILVAIRGLPSEVVLDPADDPIPSTSAVNLDSVESVSLSILTERIGTLDLPRMQQIRAALAVATDCD